MSITVSDWFKCYGDGWTGIITPAAFCHPAKFSRALIRRIYAHAVEEGWVEAGAVVLDPFGGVALGGLEAMRRGMHWVGIELEARFCALAQENIDLWNKRYAEQMPNWGTAIIVQGDSRRLGEVLERARCCISSPPYIGNLGSRDYEFMAKNFGQHKTGDYGNDPRNLGNLPDTGFEAALAEQGHTVAPEKPGNAVEGPQAALEANRDALSPPEVRPALAISSPAWMGSDMRKGGSDLLRDNRVRTGRNPDAPGTASLLSQSPYGTEPGQLAQMPEGDLALALGSPPYIETRIVDYEQTMTDRPRSGDDGVTRGYGNENGQLAALPEGDHAEACERPVCAISSPPWEQGTHGGEAFRKVADLWQSDPRNAHKPGYRPNQTGEYYRPSFEGDYGKSEGQLGQMPPGSHAEAAAQSSQQALEAGAVTGRAELCLSSPPWMGTLPSTEDDDLEHGDAGKLYVSTKGLRTRGGDRNSEAAREQRQALNSEINLGAINTSGNKGRIIGDDFWSASRQILEQVYQVLAPNAHAIFVCKRFVRNKAIVDFPLQWARLCEAVGFTWIHHHKAWLVEDRGAQHTLEGKLEKREVRRMSFFRRLHTQKYPHLAILWEDVLCFVKE